MQSVGDSSFLSSWRESVRRKPGVPEDTLSSSPSSKHGESTVSTARLLFSFEVSRTDYAGCPDENNFEGCDNFWGRLVSLVEGSSSAAYRRSLVY